MPRVGPKATREAKGEGECRRERAGGGEKQAGGRHLKQTQAPSWLLQDPGVAGNTPKGKAGASAQEKRNYSCHVSTDPAKQGQSEDFNVHPSRADMAVQS